MDKREDKTTLTRKERRAIEAITERLNWLEATMTIGQFSKHALDRKQQEAAALKWALWQLRLLPTYRRAMEQLGILDSVTVPRD